MNLHQTISFQTKVAAESIGYDNFQTFKDNLDDVIKSDRYQNMLKGFKNNKKNYIYSFKD